MAEEKRDGKNFYQFKITRDQTKSDRIKELKAKVPFSQLLAIFEIDEDESEEEIVSRLNAAVSAVVLASSYREIDAKTGKKKGKASSVDGIPDVLKNLYDVDDKLTNDDFDKYEEYEHKRKTNPDEEEVLKEEYSDVLAKKAEYDEAEEKAFGKGVELAAFEHEMETIKDLPEGQLRNLYHFYKECKKSDRVEEFNGFYAELMSETEFKPEYVYIDGTDQQRLDKDGRPIIKNEHRYSINSGRVCHSILNLNGSGLDITWMGDSFGFARSYSHMTPAQIEALARYCFDKGIDIQDFLDLKNLKVKDGDKEIGTVADELSKAIKKEKGEEENPRDDGRKGSANDTKDAKDNYKEFSSDLGQVDVKNYSPHDCLKDTSLDVRKSVMVSAAEMRSALMGNCDPALTSFKRGWNTTTISVYANENDKLVDGEIDKNGKRTRTKRFAVELTASMPPSARIYMGTDKEFSADHARLILDGFKKCGCKYFIVPPADQIGGKKAMGAWLKACVKAKMIPLCKTSEKSEGMVLGAADLHGLKEAFDEEVKSGGITGDAKIEFMLRISQQLERQEAYLSSKNPKYQTDSAVAAKMEYFKKGAMFEKLQAAYLGDIRKFIDDGIRKQGWDVADKAAAVMALGHILKDMNEGKLNGKQLNPLGRDQWKDIRESMAYYMTREKPLIVENIEDIISRSETDTQAKVDTASRQVYGNAEAYLNSVCKNIADSGIEIKIDITKDINKYYQSTYQDDKDGINEEKLYAIRFPEPEIDKSTGKLKEGEVDYRAISKRAKDDADKRKRGSKGPRTGITGRDDDDRR